MIGQYLKSSLSYHISGDEVLLFCALCIGHCRKNWFVYCLHGWSCCIPNLELLHPKPIWLLRIVMQLIGKIDYVKRQRFAAALLPRLFGNNVPGHTTRVPQVGFELAINSIKFYAKYSLYFDEYFLCTGLSFWLIHPTHCIAFDIDWSWNISLRTIFAQCSSSSSST